MNCCTQKLKNLGLLVSPLANFLQIAKVQIDKLLVANLSFLSNC